MKRDPSGIALFAILSDRFARTALALMRRSFEACARLPVDLRLSWYASGYCDRGASASRNRMALARRLLE